MEKVLEPTKLFPPSILYNYGLIPEVGVITMDPFADTIEETPDVLMSVDVKVQCSTVTDS